MLKNQGVRQNFFHQFLPLDHFYTKSEDICIALDCPESHPWAMANGTHCCERFHPANDYDKYLDWYDPESSCYNNNSLSCPNNKLCITRKEFMKPDICPNAFPIQMKNACCKSIWKKNDSNCDGGRIMDNDDPQCCQEGDLFQTSACQANKKRCMASSAVKAPDLCPESHPWALANGTRCCQKFHRINDYNKDLDWNDSASLCYGDNSIPCNSGKWCSTRAEVISPIECPHTHPVQMKNACCKSSWRKNEGICDGDLIDSEDDPACCANEYLFQPALCQENKRRCVAQVPPIDCSFEHKDYVGHDLSTTDVKDKKWSSHLDCKIQCQKLPNCEVYTYINEPSDPCYQNCFLKDSSEGGLRNKFDFIAGPKFCP